MLKNPSTELVVTFLKVVLFTLIAAIIWEFQIESIVFQGEEETAEKIKYVLTAIAFVTLGLIWPLWHLYQYMMQLAQTKKNESTLFNAVNNSYNAVFTTDINKKITFCNDAFYELTGRTPEEVIGQSPAFLHSGKHSTNFYSHIFEQVHSQDYWQGELTNVKKDGSLFHVAENISKVYGETNDHIGYVAIMSDITRLKETEQKLYQQAHFDNVTKLPNRVMLQKRMETSMEIASIAKLKMAVVFLDLDNFKNINDSLGHLEGDRLLAEVGKSLQSLVRAEDMVARLGGDEFVIIINGLKKYTDSDPIVAKIKEQFKTPLTVSGISIKVSASIGVSFFPQDGASIHELMRNADSAMFQAKKNARGSIRFYQPDLTERAQRHLLLSNELHKALENEQLSMHYQPQIQLNSEEIIGYEALIRWHHPELGFISPAEFIPLAEESGLISEIGRRVIEMVFRDIRQHREVVDGHTIAINVSAPQLMDDEFFRQLRSNSEKHNVPLSNIEVELTESVLFKDPERAEKVINELVSIGSCISVDDFGTGYSNLNYLSIFPIKKLKIDRSFVVNLNQNEKAKTLARSIISFAKELGAQVVAEGTESRAQIDLLASWGCDIAQGYYFGKPQPPHIAFMSAIRTDNVNVKNTASALD